MFHSNNQSYWSRWTIHNLSLIFYGEIKEKEHHLERHLGWLLLFGGKNAKTDWLSVRKWSPWLGYLPIPGPTGLARARSDWQHSHNAKKTVTGASRSSCKRTCFRVSLFWVHVSMSLAQVVVLIMNIWRRFAASPKMLKQCCFWNLLCGFSIVPLMIYVWWFGGHNSRT